MINTKVWAHRGASAYAPENSLEAFDLAIKMGAHGIELDIYETADGKLVIHHDNDIKRMTNGVEAKIQETNFDTLRTYNFNGTWGDQYGFVKIPALHEVLDLFRPTDMTINIELKEGSVDYLKSIAKAVKDFGMEDQIIYSSFDHIKLFPRHVHGVEVVNASQPSLANSMARLYAEKYELIMFAGSDNHIGEQQRLAGMECEEPIENELDFVEKAKAGKLRCFYENCDL